MLGDRRERHIARTTRLRTCNSAFAHTQKPLGDKKLEQEEKNHEKQKDTSAICLLQKIPQKTTEKDLNLLLDPFGSILDVKLVQSKQCAYVTFKVRTLPFSPFTRNGPIPKR